MDKDIKSKAIIDSIILILLFIQTINNIFDIAHLAKVYCALGCDLPYQELAKSVFSYLCLFYTMLIVVEKLSAIKKTMSKPLLLQPLLDVSLLKAYYITVAITILYVAISLCIVMPLGFDMKMTLVMGLCVALFFNLFAICIMWLFLKIMFHYVEVDKDRNTKESLIALGFILALFVILALLKHSPCLVHKLCPEQWLFYTYIGLSVFALVVHYPIIRRIDK